MQNDHVLKKLNIVILTPMPRDGREGLSFDPCLGSGVGEEGICGQIFATTLYHSRYSLI